MKTKTTYNQKDKQDSGARRVQWRRLLAAVVSLAFGAATAPATPVGATVGYSIQDHEVMNPNNTLQATLFTPYSRDSMPWWLNVVEEAGFANLTYLALVCRGESLNGTTVGNMPASFAANAVAALDARGSNVKLALMDDTGAYPGSYEQDNPGTQTMDLSVQANWQTYWWELKWKKFFELIPDNKRMKVQGRPVIFVWRIYLPSPGVFVNYSGNLTPLIDFLRNKCISELGFNPFIIVDGTWLQAEPSVSGAVDGVHDWYGDYGNSWTRRTHSGASGTFTTGIANPGYYVNGSTYFERNYGWRFRDALSNTVSSSDLVLVEGGTDVEENAQICRVATDVPSPHTPPSSGDLWTHPNQYLNILREYTVPYPKFVIFESEGCDIFHAPTSPSTGGIYRRKGNLNITFDGYSNWAVTLNSEEWLQFNSFQLGASSGYKLWVNYSSTSGASVSLIVDGTPVSTFNLPSTGGAHSKVATFALAAGYHDIRLKVNSGQIIVDNWTLDGL